MKSYFKYIFSSSLLAVSFFLIQCKKEQNEVVESNQTSQEISHDGAVEPTQDSIVKDSVIAQVKPREVTPFEESNAVYSAFVLPKNKKDSALAEFKKKYSEDQRNTILALNRIDKKFQSSADTLVVPNTFESDFRSYSPFPAHLDVLNDVQKMVIFSYPIQAFAVYSNGSLERWGPTSLGKKKTPTKTGLTFANWKKELSISTVSDEWKLPYNFNIYNHLGIGWHQYDLPGYPASHSCLRLKKEDAQFLFKYADQWILNPGGATTKAKGTPVFVYGDYPWGKQRPWKKLLKDPIANNVSVEELTALLEPLKDKILQEQQNRLDVINSSPKPVVKKDSTGV